MQLEVKTLLHVCQTKLKWVLVFRSRSEVILSMHLCQCTVTNMLVKNIGDRSVPYWKHSIESVV